MMPDETPVDSPAPAESEQQDLDYSQETVEQLEARFAKGEGFTDTPQDTEPETIEVAEPPVEGEPEAEVEPEGETEEAKPAEDDPEFDEAASVEEEKRLESLKRETSSERLEFLLGREAGRAGHLQKQVDELRQALVATQQPQDTDEYAEAPRAQPRMPITDPSMQASVAELQQDARGRAVEAEYNSFIQANPDATGLMEKMAPSIQEQAKQMQGMDLNVQSLRKMLRMSLNGAYAEVKLQEVRMAREEALTKRASQVPEKKKAKQVASVSGSGGSSAPRATHKSIEDLTAEEADAEMIRQFGDGVRRRVRR